MERVQFIVFLKNTEVSNAYDKLEVHSRLRVIRKLPVMMSVIMTAADAGCRGTTNLLASKARLKMCTIAAITTTVDLVRTLRFSGHFVQLLASKLT